jgi:arylsulfatase A-like enzyme
MTGPSHLSLFTSRYPQEHGARINGVALPKDSKWLALPQILRRFGYHNAAFISSWTLNSRLTRMDRWFDVYDEELTRTYQLFNSSRYAEDVTPKVLRWLDRKPERPFFLWVHYFDPHSPYHLREEFASLEKSGHPEQPGPELDAETQDRIRKYDSEIGYSDKYIGRVLDKLDKQGLRDNTIVVLTSDHGESLGEHGYVGHGRRLYDDIVRVPLIVRYPPSVPAGKVIQERVSLLDITPSVVDMTIPAEERRSQPFSFAGRSLAPALMEGESIPERPMRYVAFAGKKGFAPSWLSWMWVQESRLPLRIGLTDGAQKMIWIPGQQSLSVFNTDSDPLELQPNVLRSDDAQYKRETTALHRWFQSTDLAESEVKLSGRDTEVLKSLGYIQ